MPQENRDTEHERNCQRILGQYLVPHPADDNIVVLSDTVRHAAVLVSRTNAVALSAEATEIIHASFFNRVGNKSLPPNLKAILDPTVLSYDKVESTARWAAQSAADKLFELSDTPPSIVESSTFPVAAGDYLAHCDFGEGKIKAEYSGQVTNTRVNATSVAWYSANVSLKDKHSIVAPGSAMTVSARGPLFGTALYPQPAAAALGVNCSGCAVCAACAACAGCALCDFSPAAALGLVTVDGTLGVIGVAGAALTFGVLRAK
jgi:hypothetical protein